MVLVRYVETATKNIVGRSAISACKVTTGDSRNEWWHVRASGSRTSHKHKHKHVHATAFGLCR
jgi:hypothetical protein